MLGLFELKKLIQMNVIFVVVINIYLYRKYFVIILSNIIINVDITWYLIIDIITKYINTIINTFVSYY